MRLIGRWLREAWARRRARRDFARIRVELEALERSMSERPWWSELPPENPPRRKR
jgi:uncharacterized protein YqcC (DUF446 family)